VVLTSAGSPKKLITNFRNAVPIHRPAYSAIISGITPFKRGLPLSAAIVFGRGPRRCGPVLPAGVLRVPLVRRPVPEAVTVPVVFGCWFGRCRI
jgi:hypothetical protein